MKRILALVLCTLMTVALLAGCGSKKNDDTNTDKTWVVATDTTFRPFEYTDKDGNFVGIDVDIMAAVAADQGFKYELKSLGWDAAIAACKSKQANAMIAGASIKQDRIDSGANDTGYPENAVLWQNNAQIQVQGNCLCLIALPDGYTIPENVFALG